MRLLFFALCCSVAFAQEFDVASIKAAAAPGEGQRIFIGPARGGPGTEDPKHITWTASLSQILQIAYDAKPYQVSAPEWLGSERFEFAVVVPDDATKAQVAVMWRNLLIQRFGLKARVEKKQFDVDQLVIAPKGPKLIESTLADAPAPDPSKPPTLPSGPPRMDKDGRPIMDAPGLIMMMQMSPAGVKAQMVGRAQTMSVFAGMLGNQLQHPVIDKTGLPGKYDFNLEFTPTSGLLPGLRLAGPPPGAAAGPPVNGPAPAVESGVDLPAALQQQLGLRLNKGKGDLDYVVVETIQRVPTEN